MYVIIDWHYIGNIETGGGDEMPDFATPPMELTTELLYTGMICPSPCRLAAVVNLF